MESESPRELRADDSLAQLLFEEGKSAEDTEYKSCANCEKKLALYYFAPLRQWSGKNFEESSRCVDCRVRSQIIRAVTALRAEDQTTALSEEEKSEIFLSQRDSLRAWSSCLFKNLSKFVSHPDLGASLSRAKELVEEISVPPQASSKNSFPRPDGAFRIMDSGEKTSDAFPKLLSNCAAQPPQRSAAKRARSAIRRSAGNYVADNMVNESKRPSPSQIQAKTAIVKDPARKPPKNETTAAKENKKQTPEELIKQISNEQADLRRKALRHINSAQSTFELMRREHLNQRNPIHKDLWSMINSVSGDQEMTKNTLLNMAANIQERLTQLQNLDIGHEKEHP